MSDRSLPPLVSTAWLAGELGAPDLRVVDASWYLPSSGRDAFAEYTAGHIPGAVFFDLEKSSDQSSPLPHMLPRAEDFARRMGTLGIGDEHRIVVYDGSGANMSAGRAWWMFRTFGHRATAVLDGGIGKWRREGRPLETGLPAVPPARFTARLDPARVRDIAAVRSNVDSLREQVVDMRAAGRFEGRDPEPRPGLRGGHIPGSRNLPFDQLVASDGTLLPPDEVLRRLRAAGIDPSRPVIATCGSGTSACVLVHALEVIGAPDAAVYDGSWSEWGGTAGVPVATGPADPGD